MTAIERCMTDRIEVVGHAGLDFIEARFEQYPHWIDLLVRRGGVHARWTVSSTTSIDDPWRRIDQIGAGTRLATPRPSLLVHDLGWTLQEAAEIRQQLLPFEDDWNAPGMDAYDAL